MAAIAEHQCLLHFIMCSVGLHSRAFTGNAFSEGGQFFYHGNYKEYGLRALMRYGPCEVVTYFV